MKKMKMLTGKPEIKEPVYKITKTHEFKSAGKGHVHIYFDQYSPVRKGDKIYDIRDIQTLEIIDSGYSPVDGVMGYITYRAVNNPSELLCGINEVEILRELL